MFLSNCSVAQEIFPIFNTMQDRYDCLRFKRKQRIYSEGSTPLGVFLIQSGKVKISQMGSDAKEKIIRIAGKGEIISYTDLIANTRYDTSATALEDTNLLFVPKEEFKKTIREQQKIFDEFMMMLSLDIKLAQSSITRLAYKPVRGRLADALIELCDKFDNMASDQKTMKISRADLASYVGTAKETVTRFLSEFRRERLITTDSININILDMDGLLRVSRMYE